MTMDEWIDEQVALFYARNDEISGAGIRYLLWDAMAFADASRSRDAATREDAGSLPTKGKSSEPPSTPSEQTWVKAMQRKLELGYFFKRVEIARLLKAYLDTAATTRAWGEWPTQYTICNKSGIVDFWLEDERGNRREYFGHKVVMAAEYEVAPLHAASPAPAGGEKEDK